MQVQIQKWGNSLALRIPKTIAVDSNIEQGSVVEISLIKGKIVIIPISKPKYTLDQLLSGITKDNLHQEVDTGNAKGREEW